MSSFFNQGLFNRAGRGLFGSAPGVQLSPFDQVPEEDDRSFASDATHGALSKQVRSKAMIDLEEFGERYRASISPAREVLSDFLTAFGSKLLGQRFVPLRQQRLEEAQKRAMAAMSEERMNMTLQIAQATDQRARDLAAQNLTYKNTALTETRRRNIAMEADRLDLRDIRREALGLDERELDAKLPFLEAQINLAKARTQQAQTGAEKLPDALMETARRMAETQAIASGLDPSDPKIKAQIAAMAVTKGQELFEERRKIMAEHPVGWGPSPTRGLRGIPGLNIYGEPVLSTFNLLTGEEVTQNQGDPMKMPASQGARDDVAGTQGALVFQRQLMDQIRRNPEALRTKAQLVAEMIPYAERFLQIQNPTERNISNAMNKAVVEETKAATGLQMTNQERIFLRAINPLAIDSPLRALSQLAFKNLLDTSLLVRRIGRYSDDSNFDFGRISEIVQQDIASKSKAGQLQSFRMPSFRDIVTMAAKAKGKTAVFDPNGSFRGVQ